jgi:hypothetical protein
MAFHNADSAASSSFPRKKRIVPRTFAEALARA